MGGWTRGNYAKKSSLVIEIKGLVTSEEKSQTINFHLIVRKFGTKSGHNNVRNDSQTFVTSTT